MTGRITRTSNGQSVRAVRSSPPASHAFETSQTKAFVAWVRTEGGERSLVGELTTVSLPYFLSLRVPGRQLYDSGAAAAEMDAPTSLYDFASSAAARSAATTLRMPRHAGGLLLDS